MSEFSKVLGQMYAHADETAGAPQASAQSVSRPTTPEWADDDHLDRAFANWSPGPPPEAPAAERRFAAGLPAPVEAPADQRVVVNSAEEPVNYDRYVIDTPEEQDADRRWVIDAPGGRLDDDMAAALSAALAAAPAIQPGAPLVREPEPVPQPSADVVSSDLLTRDVPAPASYDPEPASDFFASGSKTTPSFSTDVPSAPQPVAPAAVPPASPMPAAPAPSFGFSSQPGSTTGLGGHDSFTWIDSPAEPVPAPAAVAAPAPAMPWENAAEPADDSPRRQWQRNDDDIIPRRGVRAKAARPAPKERKDRRSRGRKDRADAVVPGGVVDDGTAEVAGGIPAMTEIHVTAEAEPGAVPLVGAAPFATGPTPAASVADSSFLPNPVATSPAPASMVAAAPMPAAPMVPAGDAPASAEAEPLTYPGPPPSFAQLHADAFGEPPASGMSYPAPDIIVARPPAKKGIFGRRSR